MIALEEARRLLAANCQPLGQSLDSETVSLADAAGRICASDIAAMVSVPPADLSAMDGYAVRHADCAVGSRLQIVGESRAGTPFPGRIGSGEATLVSTGAHIPGGADRVLILEDASRSDSTVVVEQEQSGTGHIRRAGIDFARGDALVSAGERLTAARLALLAAAGHGTASVFKKPRVAILTNGDELLDPGSEPGNASIYDSNSVALAAQLTAFGADASWIGRAGDSADEVADMLARGDGSNLLVIAGGASVGPHDLVKAAFGALGGEILFSKVAVRPGKPVWFGRLPSDPRVLGLPGNPASSYVTALLFGKLAVETLAGLAPPASLEQALRHAAVSHDLEANGPREMFQRAALTHGADAATRIALTGAQDSSLLRPLAAADALLFRKANAPAAGAGAIVPYLPL